MRRTEALQGVRMIEFSSILRRCEAAELWGAGERTFRHLRRRFADAGAAGLLDRRLGKASGKHVPADCEAQVEALYRSEAGFAQKYVAQMARRTADAFWDAVAIALGG